MLLGGGFLVKLGNHKKYSLIPGTDDAEKNQYEMNMRNQVTTWGPNGEVLYK